jgi:hypothetical protein
MALALTDVLTDPVGVAAYLRGDAGLFGVHHCTGRTGAAGAAVFELALWPLPVLAAAGFPVNYARITVLANGDVLAFPRHANDRRFLHRNVTSPATLCLEYDSDDPALRWCWIDGFEQYVTRVYRHLLWEEQWRRTGVWPVEDASHVRDVPTHPVTRELKEARRRWVRVS